ncbi:endothelial zinc finger protein induced by tumor necrosis factor alpha isoform X2 [Thalassophryne amazonica]|uniref:endothelial zinc finger protein induced by tumor necrosis factor alpha isoform X2 n=1 Tax=Thalassophryne amazonica TaxID=390379 RepID=UPI001470F345|nr:endothelial zinc finger protein induced by tumor necrosis factor alpha isoform X2 [Thalassophryne amazonica]
MDKEKSVDICSWMEMQQFVGDVITAGNSSGSLKEQAEVLSAAWGLAGAEGLGFKGHTLEPLQQPRAAQEKAGGGHRRGGVDEHHGCTCPGCPYSSSPPLFETLKPRQASSSTLCSDTGGFSRTTPVNLSVCLADTTEVNSNAASHLETRPSSRLHREDAERGTRNAGLASHQNSEMPTSRASSGLLSHLSLFPCLCCHRGLQTCAQILSQQERTDSPFSHTHAHHHFHHHHCPLASCLPCPQLGHSAPLSGSFPCFSCQCSLPPCTQIGGRQHRQTRQQEERDRTAPNPMPLHPCMHCPATFNRPSQLLQHQRSEHAHKQPGFLCTECGRAFNSHSNLRIHLNVHTGARPYICCDCGKSFSQSGALKIHKRIHTGERPYSCGFCGRGFPHLAGIRAHQRIHTGEKPYCCSQCGKCFTQSGALKVHSRIHTGERPFICSICEKGFSNRSGIRFHYRTVHGLVPEATGEAAAGSPPGRPRTFPSTNPRPNTHNIPESNSHSTLNTRDASAVMAPHLGSDLLGRNSGDSQSEGSKTDSNRETLMYVCEDCGLRFKDAPSRNQHQTLVHYSSEQMEDESEEEEQGKELMPAELAQDSSKG